MYDCCREQYITGENNYKEVALVSVWRSWESNKVQ